MLPGMSAGPEIPVEFLHERLIYDPASGELRWRPAPIFGEAWNTRYAGKVAGGRNSDGYFSLCLTYRGRELRLLAHRIAFAMAYERWPVNEIDHKNRVRSDNRLANLREATDAQNSQNQKKHATNTSGYVGVTRQGRCWRAKIRVAGKRKHLGNFASIEDAGRAYLAAKQRLHLFYAGQEA